jgi:hypothetical protein
MTKEQRDAIEAAPEAPAAPPASPAAQVQKALDALNHPGNLDLQSRLAAIEHTMRIVVGQLLPLLPTE